MNAARTLATTRRVLTQLRRDPRTVALMLVVPLVLLWLLDLVFDGPAGDVRPHRAGAARALPVRRDVPRHLRRRRCGSGPRARSNDCSRCRSASLDLLLGYLLAFGLVAVVQALLASGLMLGLLDLTSPGPRGCSSCRGRRRRARLRARPVRERLRAHGVPGGAVHARGRAAPVPALRAARPARRDEPAARGDLAVLPLSYAVDAMQRITVESDGLGPDRRDVADRAGRDRARPRARRGDAAAPHRLNPAAIVRAEDRAQE